MGGFVTLATWYFALLLKFMLTLEQLFESVGHGL
jgi:hypothetical protein